MDEGTLVYTHDPDNPVQTVGGNNLFIQTPDGRDSWGQRITKIVYQPSLYLPMLSLHSQRMPLMIH